MTDGLVLTGGRSMRLGVDKATIVLNNGETIAERCVRLLREVCDNVSEVGPGFTDATCVRDDPLGGGPVAALLAGVAATQLPVVVLACDYPEMTIEVLQRLAGHSGDSLIPVVDGRPQFVAARYGPRAIAMLRESFNQGESSFRTLDLTALGALRDDFDPAPFFDIDTPADLEAFRSRESHL